MTRDANSLNRTNCFERTRSYFMNLITEEDSINGVNKMANWKTGGPDLHLYFRGTGLWN